MIERNVTFSHSGGAPVELMSEEVAAIYADHAHRRTADTAAKEVPLFLRPPTALVVSG